MIEKIQWVQKTVAKMNATGTNDSEMWNSLWLATYKELGGTSENYGSKVCPKAAAYGLWFLGRITGSNRPCRNWPIEKVRKELGKNSAYAILSLTFLERKEKITKLKLWQEVKKLYRQEFSEEPAESEEGAVSIASVLFKAGKIISPHSEHI